MAAAPAQLSPRWLAYAGLILVVLGWIWTLAVQSEKLDAIAKKDLPERVVKLETELMGIKGQLARIDDKLDRLLQRSQTAGNSPPWTTQ